MHNMNKILVTAGTHALAYRIKNELNGKLLVSLATADDIPSILKDQFIKLPSISSTSIVHEILKIALDNNFTYILPLSLTEIIKLSESLTLFEEYNITILVPEFHSLRNIQTIKSPNKNLPLSLIHNGYDIISGKPSAIKTNGLIITSDSEEEFALATL